MIDIAFNGNDDHDNDENHGVDDLFWNVVYGGVAWGDNIYPGSGGVYSDELL